MNADQPEPKIIVDEDYKARVKAEKEAAARAEAAKAATPGTQQTGGQEPSPAGAKELPPASFATLVNQLAVQALVRRDQLEPAARVDLFAQLAAHFRSKVVFPAEALDGITDEQYVRNVVDVLYRTGQAQVSAAKAAIVEG